MNHLVQTYQAQVMRLGYSSSARESIRSFAILCGSVFIASWEAGEDFIRAMDARCYSGKFVVLGENRPIEAVPALVMSAFLITSSLVVVIAGSTTLL
jgi:cobalt/nickel transport system permease protein